MKKFILVACLLMIGFVLVGCSPDNDEVIDEELLPMTFDVEVLEINDTFILARGISDSFQDNLMFNHLHLPDIGIWEGANVTITTDPIFLETDPVQVRVIEWQHANIIFDVEVIEIAEMRVLVRGIEAPFLNWNFDFNHTNLSDIGIYEGAHVTLTVRGGDWPMPDPVPLSVVSWELTN